MKIKFGVAVEAEFEVRKSDYHYDESENCWQWFMQQAFNAQCFASTLLDGYVMKNVKSKEEVIEEYSINKNIIDKLVRQ